MFEKITLIANSLIVLDIDDTVLKYDGISKLWWKLTFNKYYNIHNDYDRADKESLDEWEKLLETAEPLHTNESILPMLERAEELNCKIIFLTARHDRLIDITKKHLTELNIKPYKIYFTGGQCKGAYLKAILSNYVAENVIFIDDLESNIEAVKWALFGYNLQTYLYS